jgi:hypothetical protein
MAAPYYAWTRSHGDEQAHVGGSGIVDNIVPGESKSGSKPLTLADAAWQLGLVETVYESVRHAGELRTLGERWAGIGALVDFLATQTDPALGVMRNQSIL